MKALLNTTNTIRSFIAGATALIALGATTTTAEAHDHHHRSCHSSYNPLYGNYAYYHGGKGPTSGFWGDSRCYRPAPVYRPSCREYPRYSYDSCDRRSPVFSFRFWR